MSALAGHRQSWVMDLRWSALLAVLLGMLGGCGSASTEVAMPNNSLTCALVASANADGSIKLAFDLSNHGTQAVRLAYFEPFVAFDLSVRTADGPAELVQPGLDLRARPAEQTLAPGQSHQISTPIRLRFNPDVGPAGGDDPLVWSIRHTPAPLTIEATLRLSEVNIAPCTTTLSPGR